MCAYILYGVIMVSSILFLKKHIIIVKVIVQYIVNVQLYSKHHFCWVCQFCRALTFLKKSFDGTVPVMELAPEDETLVATVTKELRAFNEGLDKMK